MSYNDKIYPYPCDNCDNPVKDYCDGACQDGCSAFALWFSTVDLVDRDNDLFDGDDIGSDFDFII